MHQRNSEHGTVRQRLRSPSCVKYIRIIGSLTVERPTGGAGVVYLVWHLSTRPPSCRGWYAQGRVCGRGGSGNEPSLDTLSGKYVLS